MSQIRCVSFKGAVHLLTMKCHSDEFAEVCERAQKAMAAQAPEGLVTIQEYARMNGVSVRTVQKRRAGDAHGHDPVTATVFEFIAENGGGAGVRLNKGAK